MEQRHIISGFSDLKELLVRTYPTERSRDQIRLFFSEKENELFMHDYADHKKEISLCANIAKQSIRLGLSRTAEILIFESFKQKSPSNFLNNAFKLNGFFRF